MEVKTGSALGGLGGGRLGGLGFDGVALALAIAVLRARLAGFSGRWGTADAQFLDQKDFREPEAATGEFPGVVVREKLHAFLADLSDIDFPCFFAEVVHGEAGTVLGLAAGLLLLAAAGFLLAPALLFLAALLFLLAAEVFLFTPLLILLAALLVGLLPGLRIAGRGLILALGGWWRRGRVGRFIRGGRGCFR